MLINKCLNGLLTILCQGGIAPIRLFQLNPHSTPITIGYRRVGTWRGVKVLNELINSSIDNKKNMTSSDVGEIIHNVSKWIAYLETSNLCNTVTMPLKKMLLNLVMCYFEVLDKQHLFYRDAWNAFKIQNALSVSRLHFVYKKMKSNYCYFCSGSALQNEALCHWYVNNIKMSYDLHIMLCIELCIWVV